jgi:esterase/lipase superfamily enzyme
MKECMELNRNPIEDYAIQFIGEKNAQKNYDDFKYYMTKQGYKYEMTRKSFELKFNKFIDKHNIEKINCDKIIDGERIRIIYKHKLMITM